MFFENFSKYHKMLYHSKEWSDLHQISVYTIQVKYGEFHGLVEMTLKLDLQGQILRSNVNFCCFLLIFTIFHV